MNKITRCPACGAANRLRAAAAGAPHCGRCGAPLPWLVEAGDADFADVAERSPLPVLVDFWAPWCGPCRLVEPVVERLAHEQAGKLKVVKVNSDLAPDLTGRFGVRGIPTLVLLRDGREVDRVAGALDAGRLAAWVGSRLAA